MAKARWRSLRMAAQAMALPGLPAAFRRSRKAWMGWRGSSAGRRRRACRGPWRKRVAAFGHPRLAFPLAGLADAHVQPGVGGGLPGVLEAVAGAEGDRQVGGGGTSCACACRPRRGASNLALAMSVPTVVVCMGFSSRFRGLRKVRDAGATRPVQPSILAKMRQNLLQAPGDPLAVSAAGACKASLAPHLLYNGAPQPAAAHELRRHPRRRRL